MPTSASILTAIGEIITGAKYKANQMRPLLENIFNVSSSFYSGATDPVTSNDNTQNFRVGSFGRNTSTGRYFICANAATGNAVWQNLNDDFAFNQATITDGSTTSIPARTAYFTANGSGIIDEAIIKLPPPTYLGKTVEILVLGNVTTAITIVNEANIVQAVLDSFRTDFGCIKLVCTDVSSQTWKRTFISL